jgi:DNA-directed RNA polymerase
MTDSASMPAVPNVFNDLDLSALPQIGDLDIRQVLESPYFFA